jgi:hypothetical protein
MKKVLPLILFSILVLVGYANGQNEPVTWVGDVSFSVKVNGVGEGSKGNEKFEKDTYPFDGKCYIFVGDEGPIKKENYYIEIRDDDENIVMGIKELAAIGTDYVKLGKSNKFKLVGTGDFFDPETGSPGIAYMDSKGTLKEDKTTGDMTSISISGKLGGGCNSDDINYTFSASFKSELVPLSQ